MKRLMVVAAICVVAGWCHAGPVRLAFRDYRWDTPEIGFLSAGVTTWHSKADPFLIGGYCSVNMLILWDERLNFGIGLVGANTSDDFRVRWVTTMNAHFFDFLELGAWYAMFYGYKGKDDPYGFKAGYYFKF